jgi:hypothetical protein
MQKTIVTHYSPDFDGIPAIWILKKFHPDFEDAKVIFLPAGQTLDDKPAGSDPDVVHIDTGGGPFDHHETNEYTCAAKLVWEWLKKDRGITDEVIERLMPTINVYDHGKEVEWGDALDDKYELMLPALIDGWKVLYPGQYEKVLEFGMKCMDAAYGIMKSKIEAEKILAKGEVFDTKWGRGIGVETENEAVLQLGEKMGYSLVVKKDSKRQSVRIYGRSDRGVDLSQACEKIKKLDPDARWFLHASGCLLLNGSAKQPRMNPTKLSLEEVIEVLKRV